MKIVVLDGGIVNPGNQFSWAKLQATGECHIYEDTTPAQFEERTRGAEAIITNKVPLTRERIESIPTLHYIGVPGTGTDAVDTAAAKERNIVVANSPDYGAKTVAQAAFALTLELTNHVAQYADSVRDGTAHWGVKPQEYWQKPNLELQGMTMGVIGAGNIGKEFAKRAAAFDMEVLIHSRTPKPLIHPVEYVGLEALFRRSDFISVHAPLTKQTRGLVSKELIELMKPTAFIINTSRGGLIDEQALANALNNGRIAGAGLDVLSTEPPKADNPLLGARNVIINPHMAWATFAARKRLLNMSVDNAKAFAAGKPINIVNA